MKNRDLLWIVPLCLFIGWTVGFWIGIPQHITFSADERLELGEKFLGKDEYEHYNELVESIHEVEE